MGERFEFQGMAAALDKELVITSNYINIPIMVKYRLSPFFSVEAGPQVGFNVYNKIKIDGVDGNLDLDRVSHTVDLGLGAGATYYLTDYVMFHVRYNMDFLNSYKYIDDKNGNIQIGASYRSKFKSPHKPYKSVPRLTVGRWTVLFFCTHNYLVISILNEKAQ